MLLNGISKFRTKAGKHAGFTYIEMLVALALVGICFVPMLQMYAGVIQEVDHYSEMGTAMNLAREGMEKLHNLRLSQAQLSSLSDVWDPPMEKPAFELNHRLWRIKRLVVPGSNPLEVHIQAFRDDQRQKPIIDLTTLFMDW